MESTQNGGVLEKKEIGLSIDTSGTHFNTEIDETNNSLRLKKIVTDNLGNSIYEQEGYWVSNIIDLEDKFADFEKVFTANTTNGSSSNAILTRVSSDSLNWSDWVEVAMDGTIQSDTQRFIQIKIKLFAGFDTIVHLISSFNNKDDAKLFDSNFIDTSNGLRLKRDYNMDMNLDSSWNSEGSLYRKKVNREEWTRIDKLNVLRKEFE